MRKAISGLSHVPFPLASMDLNVHALISFANVFPVLVNTYGADQSNQLQI